MSVMPAPGLPRTVAFPTPHETQLSNGLRVIAIAREELHSDLRIPLISAAIIFDRGSAADPPDLPGVAAMTAALLTQGTAQRTALELSVAVDEIGARLERAASFDVTSVGVSATVPSFEATLRLMAETVREPAFASEEIERVRARSLSDLQLSYSSPSSLARLVANRVIAGASPYGHPVAGTAASLRAIGRDDLTAFHGHAFRPEHATLLIGGDIGVDETFALAERAFGDWRRDARPDRTFERPAAPAPRRRVVAIDRPDAGRTAIAIGRLGISRASRDYDTGVVATAILSGYSGRLNQEVRVKRGLSYGAGASLIARRDPGMILASTLVEHARASETVRVMLDTFATLAERPPGTDELAARKATLSGGFSRSIETTDGLLGALGDYALHGIALDELAGYLERVGAVTSEHIAAFAAEHIVPDSSIVLVGDVSRFRNELSALAQDVTVIPGSTLDLDHAI